MSYSIPLPYRVALLVVVCVFGRGSAMASATQPPRSPHPVARVVELKASDGTLLKASYFAAAKPGPGVLLLHQFNRTRKSWDEVAKQLAAAGINTLTLDLRGYGESGGTPHGMLTPEERAAARERRPGDIDTAWQYLVTQPGVDKDVIGVGGAGGLGVGNSIETARRHSSEVRSLALLSGDTLLPGLRFLREASQLPGLFVVSDDDEYPPTAEAMERLYIHSSNPSKQFVHYVGEEAPWLWYESEPAVAATGSHGTDLFGRHPELPDIIVHWFVTTLIKTPGRAPPQALASSKILDQIERPGGVLEVTRQLIEARQKDPQVQLWPEISVGLIAQDHMLAGETKLALETFKLNLLAFPQSADANESYAEALLHDGQKALARQYAEKALEILAAHKVAPSSWADTEERRGEIRLGAQQVLDNLNGTRR